MSLDLFLLDKVFQPLSQWLFKKTGVVNYTFARWFFLIATLGLFCSAGSSISEIIRGEEGASFLRAVIPLLICRIVIRELKLAVTLEQRWQDGSHKLPPNLRDPGLSEAGGIVWNRRITIWLLLVLIAFDVSHVLIDGGEFDSVLRIARTIFTYIWLFGESVGLFFLACLPPPPGSTKEQEFKLANTVA